MTSHKHELTNDSETILSHADLELSHGSGTSTTMTEPTPAQFGRRTFLQWFSYGLGACRGGVRRSSLRRLPAPNAEVADRMGNAGPVEEFPVERDPDGDVRQPDPRALGRHDGTHRGLRPLRRQGKHCKRISSWSSRSICAHLGCPVSWFPQSGLFMCPCHGGVYYGNGERASGPPPRGLYRCVWRIRKGQLESPGAALSDSAGHAGSARLAIA